MASQAHRAEKVEKKGRLDTSAKKLTDALLMKLDPGEHVIRAGLRGQGSLILRLVNGSRPCYFRYFHGAAKKLELIGHHDPKGAENWSVNRKGGPLQLAAIIKGFQVLQDLQLQHGDLKAYYAQLELERRKQKQQEDAEALAGTFQDLLEAYTASLKNADTRREVERMFKRNVIDAFPALAQRRANDISAEDIVEILRRMHQRGVKRGVNVCRAFVRAAFSMAMKMELDPRRDVEKRFAISSNPVADVPVLSEKDEETGGTQDVYARMGERTLNEGELRYYRDRLASIRSPVTRACLILHLYTGQRIRQIIAALWTAYDFEKDVVTLIDSKGRNALARPHVVPLTRQALAAIEIVKPLTGHLGRPFANSKRAKLNPTTIAHAVKAISDEMVKEKIASQEFSASDVRRTCQTALASLNVPAANVDRFLSHNRPGRIAQTYDKYEYLAEKRHAAEVWAAFVDSTHADDKKVVSMKKRA